MGTVFEARVARDGTIEIPKAIRKALGIEGGKVSVLASIDAVVSEYKFVIE